MTKINISNKHSLGDYTKAEFAKLLKEIFSAKGDEAYQDKIIHHFQKIVPNPEGMDMIFWVPDDEANSETIIRKIEAYCKSNALPSFQVSKRRD